MENFLNPIVYKWLCTNTFQIGCSLLSRLLIVTYKRELKAPVSVYPGRRKALRLFHHFVNLATKYQHSELQSSLLYVTVCAVNSQRLTDL